LPITITFLGHAGFLLDDGKVVAQGEPAEILELPKRGFTLPMAQWLRGSLREYAHGLLFEQGLESWTPYLREPAVRAMWQAHQAGRQDHSMRLWIILSWVLWHRALLRR